ncbi:MAG: glutamine-hydrolyzing carbamoyl-phosphate synthase small subunit [Candidatus Omnitrophota bacterium]
MKAILVLEDGRIFEGESSGAQGEAIGELMPNTAVVGYQEMMTDPANIGKILILTYPLIGNYGCAQKFNESSRVWLAGMVIKEKSRIFSNWQAKEGFGDFAKASSLPVISALDTRTLAVHLRQKGRMLGVISTRCFDVKQLRDKIAALRNKPAESQLPRVCVSKPVSLGKARGRKLAVLDLGITRSIIRQIKSLGFSMVLFPYNTPADKIRKIKPDALVISNGPEQDPALKEVADNIKPLLGELPILAISTGCQVLSLALGAKVSKMKVGHHGVNYPIHSPVSYKGEITVQNHSYVVDIESLNKIKDVRITAYNLNDHSVEEIESRRRRFIGVQYYPVSPGFNEVHSVFTRFSKLL